VLDSEEGEVDFDTLYVNALAIPDDALARVDALTAELRQKAEASRKGAGVLGPSRELDPGAAQKVAGPQLPFWTERATLSWLRSQADRGAKVDQDSVGHWLRWPDGTEVRRAVFTRREAELPGTEHLSLEDSRIRSLATRLPYFAPGQPLAAAAIPGVSDKVGGVWSLWRVALRTDEGCEQRLLPLFLSDDRRMLAPTARTVWERLIEMDGDAIALEPAALSGEAAEDAFRASERAAEEQGAPLYDELRAVHRDRLARERRKGEQAFDARRRLISRVGLEQVRDYRMRQLEEERRQWEARTEALAKALPELNAILMLRVAQSGEGG